jgi:hypothetical protein
LNKFKKEILWQLASNDGWNKIEGVIYDLKKCADGSELCFANIVIKGKFWQRDLVACDESECAELLQDFEVSLFQIALKYEQIRHFILELKDWSIAPKPVDVELSGIGSQSLKFNFDVSDKYICSIDKPVCTIEYSTERLNGKCEFIVDQSCIINLCQNLEVLR